MSKEVFIVTADEAGRRIDKFLKEMGAPRIEPIDVLKITKSNLPQETQVVVLNHK